MSRFLKVPQAPPVNLIIELFRDFGEEHVKAHAVSGDTGSSMSTLRALQDRYFSVGVARTRKGEEVPESL